MQTLTSPDQTAALSDTASTTAIPDSDRSIISDGTTAIPSGKEDEIPVNPIPASEIPEQ